MPCVHTLIWLFSLLPLGESVDQQATDGHSFTSGNGIPLLDFIRVMEFHKTRKGKIDLCKLPRGQNRWNAALPISRRSVPWPQAWCFQSVQQFL